MWAICPSSVTAIGWLFFQSFLPASLQKGAKKAEIVKKRIAGDHWALKTLAIFPLIGSCIQLKIERTLASLALKRMVEPKALGEIACQYNVIGVVRNLILLAAVVALIAVGIFPPVVAVIALPFLLAIACNIYRYRQAKILVRCYPFSALPSLERSNDSRLSFGRESQDCEACIELEQDFLASQEPDEEKRKEWIAQLKKETQLGWYMDMRRRLDEKIDALLK